MKKNLRIVSAAAAALLTVAPVVASTSTVFAADTTSSTSSNSDPSTGAISVTGVNGNIPTNTDNGVNDIAFISTVDVNSLKDGADASTVKATITGTIGVPKVDNGSTYIFKLNAAGQIVGKDNQVIGYGEYTKENAVKTIVSGERYVAVTPNVTVSGLTPGKKYNLFNTYNVVASEYGNITSKEMGMEHNIISDPFSIPDQKFGTPMFYLSSGTNEGRVLKNYNYNLSSKTSVSDIAADLVNNIKVKVDAEAGHANDTASIVSLWDQKHIIPVLNKALKDAGVEVKDGSFDMPAGDVTVKFTATASNKNTGNLTVTLRSSVGDNSFYPVLVQHHATATDGTKTVKANSTYKVFELTDANKKLLGVGQIPVGGNVDVPAIRRAFGAEVSSVSTNPLDLDVDSSKVNPNVAGIYPITLSATNPNGFTTTASYNIVVGDPGAVYKTVQSDGDIPVYTINGNNITKSNTTVSNGTQVATYGMTTVGNNKYVRINSFDSNQYIESQYVDGTFKPSATSSKTVMHNAYVYGKDHKRIGTKKVTAYTTVNVLGDKTKLDDGTAAYMIKLSDGTIGYIDAGNVDGFPVTLNHNSYIYKTSKKRANKKKLHKGATVTVYGAPVTLKNGVKYYRIGVKRFIKAANADIVK